MSTMMIRDLPQSRELDGHAMSTVRGGFMAAPNGPFADVEINIDIDQKIFQASTINLAILNDSVVGAPIGLDLTLAPTLTGDNTATVGRFFKK